MSFNNPNPIQTPSKPKTQPIGIQNPTHQTQKTKIHSKKSNNPIADPRRSLISAMPWPCRDHFESNPTPVQALNKREREREREREMKRKKEVADRWEKNNIILYNMCYSTIIQVIRYCSTIVKRFAIKRPDNTFICALMLKYTILHRLEVQMWML